jgi:Immunity protein 42
MIIGDPALFAIESEITRAIGVEDRFLPSGFFTLHVGGRRYGVHAPDATLLPCSVSEVEDRIARRGGHVAAFADQSAGEIADAYRDAIYAPNQEEKDFFRIPFSRFESMIHESRMVWAPDGDEAFDDGSYVLHFDVANRVRLIAFTSQERGYHHAPDSLRDVWCDADEFYRILSRWREDHEAAWQVVLKEKRPNQ